MPTLVVSVLALTYSEHLGTACGAYTLSCRLTILHGDGLGILHLPLRPALDTIRLHYVYLPFWL